MGAGHPTGCSYLANHLTLADTLTEYHVDFAQVSEQLNQPLAMVDIDQVATEEEIPQFNYRAGARRQYWGAGIRRDIHTAMRALGLPIEHAPTAETAGLYARYRQ